MLTFNNDFIVIYRTSKRLNNEFIDLMKSQVEAELPGLRFYIESSADINDKVEVEVEGTETDEAFHDQKAFITNRVLAIADHLWQQFGDQRARGAHSG